MRKPNLAKLQAMVDAWNARFPIGTPVVCKKDSGEKVETVTTSEAQVLSGHSAVIWMKDIRGCYDLSRVRAL